MLVRRPAEAALVLESHPLLVGHLVRAAVGDPAALHLVPVLHGELPVEVVADGETARLMVRGHHDQRLVGMLLIELIGHLDGVVEPDDGLHHRIDAVLVACVKPYMDYMWEMKEKYSLSKLKWVCEGGDTFQGSVLNGVRYLEDKIERDDIVLVHFGASPFITGDIITDCIRVCKEKGNAISSTDYYVLSGKKISTVSVANPENYSEEYIDRETIAVMNSPHAFRFGFIDDLYKDAIETGIIDTVEPHTTTLMYAMGKKIYFALGSQNNIKITRKEDLELFEGYVLEQERKCKETVIGDVIVLLADGFEESGRQNWYSESWQE